MNTKNTLDSKTHSFNPGQMLFTILALLVIVSFTSLAYAEYPSPSEQIKSGVAPEDIRCNADFVHVLRDNGSHACVTEKTAERVVERFGWIIIPQPAEPEIIEIAVGSSGEHIDDERYIQPAKLQGTAPPRIISHWISSYQYNPSNIVYDKSDNTDFTASINVPYVPHEKYSRNSEGLFYVEDWIPEYIPKGYKLLYVHNHCTPGFCQIELNFVPNAFEYHERIMDYELQQSKGFSAFATYVPHGHDEVEDKIEEIEELYSSQAGYVGGHVKMSHNGKQVYAFEGGTFLNHYHSSIVYLVDDNYSYGVNSFYLSLEEITPIFKSMMK